MSSAIRRALRPLAPAYRPARTLVKRSQERVLHRLDAPVVILLYHRVTTLTADPHSLAVTPEHFRAQMRWLKEALPVLRFEEDWSSQPRPAAVVTFDDGYADNALEALPILEETGVPATFFIATGTIGTRIEFWWDELERLVLASTATPDHFVLGDDRSGHRWPTVTAAQRRALFDHLHRMMKGIDIDRRERLLQRLRAWLSVGTSGRPSHRAMTVDELRRLARSPLVTIGAHTVHHPSLAVECITRQREEIEDSRHQLEAWTGRAIEVFSYPFGARGDYGAETVGLCKALSIRRAAANVPGHAHRRADPYQLPRQMVLDWPVDVFAGCIAHFLAA